VARRRVRVAVRRLGSAGCDPSQSVGLPLAYIQKLGAGSVVLLADPLIICNGYREADKGACCRDLLGLVDANAAVGFDEYTMA